MVDKAIRKYGKQNFTFKIIGWFEDYNEKEKYYIQYYRSLVPNGYNILQGGEEPPVMKGVDNPNAKITEETAFNVKKDLKNFKIPRKQIVKNYNITHNIMRHINEGNTWRDEKESYPLRPPEKEINNLRAETIIKLLITTNLTQKSIGQEVGWNRSAVTMINIGKNHFNEKVVYPIRENKEKNKELLNL